MAGAHGLRVPRHRRVRRRPGPRARRPRLRRRRGGAGAPRAADARRPHGPHPAPDALRAPRDGGAARVESLHDQGFEFPICDRRGPDERTWTWGARVAFDGARSTSTVIALDHRAGTLREHHAPGWVFGEPVFARRPGSHEEGDGVLLSVGSHVRDDRALLRVFAPRTLEVLADVEVDVPLPMGYHGGFAPARRTG
ncbi:MAG: carotenoid oxygenase family protein [Polyangiales bacterium]